MAENILSPVGRLVAGSLYKGNTTDFDGNPLVVKTGANAGQPRTEWSFALAVPKQPGETSWRQSALGKKIEAIGAAAFPQKYQWPTFAWKVKDGDDTLPNRRGKRNVDKEGWAGHWVFFFSSGYAPRVYQLDAGNKAQVWDQPDAINLGDWIEVSGTCGGNGNDNNPGVYLNHSMVCFRGYGQRITVGPDADSVGFGATALPAGASNVPPAGFTPPATTAPPVPAPVAPAAPAPAAPPPVTAVTPVPMVPTAPPVPAPAVERSASKDGATWPLKTMTDGGWTEPTLLAAGYVIN